MPVIPVAVFAAKLRELEYDEFVGFVAALWEASGWDTETDWRTVLARRDTMTQTLLVLPPGRFLRVRSAPETDHTVDQVVTAHSDGEGPPVRPRNTPAVPVIDAEDILNRLLYAIDEEAGERLLVEHLGVSPRGEQWVPQDPALVRLGHRASRVIEPAERHVSRRAALGTLGFAAVAGSTWVLLDRDTQGGEQTAGQLDDPTTSTPETSVSETASFTFATEDGTVTITHDGGTVIAAEQLLIRSNGLEIPSETTWSGIGLQEPGDIVSEGDALRLEGSQRFEIAVLLDRGDELERLGSFSQGQTDTVPTFETPPNAAFAFDYNESEREMRITHDRGDIVEAGALFVRGTGFDEAPSSQWSDQAGFESDSAVRPGESAHLPSVRADVSVRVVWQEGAETRLLDQFYGPGRPLDETFSGAPDDRYGPRGTGFAGDVGPGRDPLERWRYLHSGVAGTSTAVQQGVVVFAGTDGTVFALDAADGVELWRRRLSGSTAGAPTVANGRIYLRQFSREQSGLVSLDLRDGSILWTVEIPQQNIGKPVFSDGSLYLAATGGPSSSSAVYSFGASNARSNWSTPVDDFLFPAYLAVGENSVFTTPTNGVVRLDLDGGSPSAVYETPEETSGLFWGPMVVGNTVVALLVAEDQTSVYRVTKDGEVRWQTALSGTPATRPVAGVNRLFVASQSGGVVALALEGGDQDWEFTTSDSVTALTATTEFVYAAQGDTIHVLDPVAGTEMGRNVKPGEELRSLVAVKNMLFATGQNVFGLDGRIDFDR